MIADPLAEYEWWGCATLSSANSSTEFVFSLHKTLSLQDKRVQASEMYGCCIFQGRERHSYGRFQSGASEWLWSVVCAERIESPDQTEGGT
eukprot:m.64735 g.64735  ORF g.64735 m.64735 type:complete len:91 (+) comp9729_c0_seq2:2288-2560(+)